MGFYQCDYEILDYLKANELFFKGASVLEFGSQDLIEDRFGNVYGGGGGRISARCIYDDYGFGKYACIDLDGGHDCLQFDLGLSFHDHYHFYDTFDLISVKEIGHWIFDQKTLWTNIHNALNVGGCLIWRSPIAGAFGAGCFTYLPKKILQLGFCNHYLYRGAWIFEQLSGLSGAKFGSWDNGHFDCLGNSAYDFLENLQAYLSRDDSWRIRPLSDGIPLIRLTMVFQKLCDTPFVPPTFPYIPIHEAVCRNAKSVLLNCLPQAPNKKIAIFGTANAGALALNFAKAAGLEVVCFVDDFVEGERFGIPIVDWERFLQDKQQLCDFILLGPYQNGDLSNRHGCIIPTARLNAEWFV